MYNINIEFEYDPNKSETNVQKGKVRIISARRSRIKEELVYYERAAKKEKDNS